MRNGKSFDVESTYRDVIFALVNRYQWTTVPLGNTWQLIPRNGISVQWSNTVTKFYFKMFIFKRWTKTRKHILRAIPHEQISEHTTIKNRRDWFNLVTLDYKFIRAPCYFTDRILTLKKTIRKPTEIWKNKVKTDSRLRYSISSQDPFQRISQLTCQTTYISSKQKLDNGI